MSRFFTGISVGPERSVAQASMCFFCCGRIIDPVNHVDVRRDDGWTQLNTPVGITSLARALHGIVIGLITVWYARWDCIGTSAR